MAGSRRNAKHFAARPPLAGPDRSIGRQRFRFFPSLLAQLGNSLVHRRGLLIVNARIARLRRSARNCRAFPKQLRLGGEHGFLVRPQGDGLVGRVQPLGRAAVRFLNRRARPIFGAARVQLREPTIRQRTLDLRQLRVRSLEEPVAFLWGVTGGAAKLDDAGEGLVLIRVQLERLLVRRDRFVGFGQVASVFRARLVLSPNRSTQQCPRRCLARIQLERLLVVLLSFAVLALAQRRCPELDFVGGVLLIGRGRGLSRDRGSASQHRSESQQECRHQHLAILRTHSRPLSIPHRAFYRRFHHPVAAKILATAAGEVRRFDTSSASCRNCSSQARCRSCSGSGFPRPMGKSLCRHWASWASSLATAAKASKYDGARIPAEIEIDSSTASALCQQPEGMYSQSPGSSRYSAIGVSSLATSRRVGIRSSRGFGCLVFSRSLNIFRPEVWKKKTSSGSKCQPNPPCARGARYTCR